MPRKPRVVEFYSKGRVRAVFHEYKIVFEEERRDSLESSYWGPLATISKAHSERMGDDDVTCLNNVETRLILDLTEFLLGRVEVSTPKE